jgi:hypothetical protein
MPAPAQIRGPAAGGFVACRAAALARCERANWIAGTTTDRLARVRMGEAVGRLNAADLCAVTRRLEDRQACSGTQCHVADR